MIAALLFCCTFLLMRIDGTTTFATTTTTTPTTHSTTTPYPGVRIRLGGEGNPTVTVTKNGHVCKNVKIPDVPQPSYGEPGRIGSYATTWGQSAMVCGGYTGSGPPFSQYKDCQILDLNTKTWSLGPKLINYTASRESKKVGDVFYIFGGSYPANPGPGPTVWREHNITQALDLNNLEEGWRVVQSVQTLADDLSHQDRQHFQDQSRNPTTVIVSSRFFPTCTITMTTTPTSTATTAAATTTTTVPILTTPTTTTPYPGVQIRLGGEGNPTVTVTKNGNVCKNVKIPDVPQPSYGEPGRIGSYATTWGQSAMVCGGYTGSGPPFSQYKDCQILDLNTKAWSLGPKLRNYTASRASLKDGNAFYIYGGSYPSNPRPGPTIWVDHNQVQVLDLLNLERGWGVVGLPIHEGMQKEGATRSSTTIVVPSRFFPSC